MDFRYKRDDWEEQFKSWKDKNKRKESIPSNNAPAPRTPAKVDIFSDVKKEIGIVERKIVREEKELINYAREPRNVKIIKIIALLIPLIIIAYLLYANVLVSKNFVYHYDIGSENNYLSPLTRVSEKVNGTGDTYRNLTSSLVYFNVPIPRGSKNINVSVRFRDTIPEGYGFNIGAKDKDVWHYEWKTLYNPVLEQLNEFYVGDGVYKINKNDETLSKSQIIDKQGIVIGTTEELGNTENKITGYTNSTTVIKNSLRGGHTFYIYAKDDLQIKVFKQDINWYNGSDEMGIEFYDGKDNLISNYSMSDDGVTEAIKDDAPIQEVTIDASNLKEGVYKLVFEDFDGLIRELRITSNKVIVANRVYLADSDIFFPNLEKENIIYTNLTRKGQISFNTWHKEGYQDVKINDKVLSVKERVNETAFIGEGFYEMHVPKNDLIISTPGYFAFSKEAYFEPFRNRMVSIKNDKQWILDNVDYVVSNYNQPVKDGEWIIANVDFDIKDLYIQDNKLNMVLNAPHLNQDAYVNYTVPVDYIESRVYKKGVIQ